MRDSQQGQGIHVFSINGPLKSPSVLRMTTAMFIRGLAASFTEQHPLLDKTHTLNRNVMYTNNKDIIIITQAPECQNDAAKPFCALD